VNYQSSLLVAILPFVTKILWAWFCNVCCGISVPYKKISHWANVCFSAHAIARPLQTHNQWSVSSVTRAMRFIYDIKFGMLQVRENEMLLRNWSGGTAHMRTLEGSLCGIYSGIAWCRVWNF